MQTKTSRPTRMHLIYDEPIEINGSDYRWRLWAAHGRPYVVLVSPLPGDKRQPSWDRCKLATYLYNAHVLRIANGGPSAFIYTEATCRKDGQTELRMCSFDRINSTEGVRFYAANTKLIDWRSLEDMVGEHVDRS